jgi:hypothetical protein
MTNPSRRTVLRAGVVFAAASGPLAVSRQAMSAVAGGMSSNLRRATFRPHVGSVFRLGGDDAGSTAVLHRVADVPGARGSDQQFRLLFHTNGAGPGQGTYAFRHSTLPTVHLFVTPIGKKAGVYEAVVDTRH